MERSAPRHIHGETKLLGLLGKDATYSLSPAMHNRAIQLFNLDQVYVNFDLESASVESFLDIFWKLGGRGLNVTKPHKGLVASLIPGCKLKSVNTLVRTEIGWDGHSTDGLGFARGLDRLGISLDSVETIVVLGAGGAAQSIVDYACHQPASMLKTIVILRRGESHDSAIINIVDAKVLLEIQSLTPEHLQSVLNQHAETKTLLIQATSVSSSLEPGLKEFVPCLDGYKGAVVDLIYNKPTALYFSALIRGLKTQDGLPMLIEQARASQHLWWGKSASYEDLATAIKRSGQF